MAPAEAGACETSPLSSQRGTCSGRKSRARECWLRAGSASLFCDPLAAQRTRGPSHVSARLPGGKALYPRAWVHAMSHPISGLPPASSHPSQKAPGFCCRAPGSAGCAPLLGGCANQERTVVGSCFVLRCLRQAPIGSSVSESMRCRNRSAPSPWHRMPSWWSRGESNPRPTHINVDIQGCCAAHTTIFHCGPIKAQVNCSRVITGLSIESTGR